MRIFECVGIIVVAGTAAYFVFYCVYKWFRDQAVAEQCVVDFDEMPELQPIPIPTKNQPRWWLRLMVMVYEPRRWILKDNWIFTLPNGTDIVLHKGFEFDGASIPRPFWSILNPAGLLLIPGLVHDYAYRYNQLWRLAENGEVKPFTADAPSGGEKDYWDRLFFDLGKALNGLVIIHIVATVGVMLGGKGAWRRHRQENQTPPEPVLNQPGTGG